jgi:hypothetical protein
MISTSPGDERSTGTTVHARIKTINRAKLTINQVTIAGAGLNGILRGKWVSGAIQYQMCISFTAMKKTYRKKIKGLKWLYWSPERLSLL